MTRARRCLGPLVLAGLLISACRSAEPAEPSVAVGESPVSEPIAIEQEPTPVEPPVAEVRTWRFTTLVTGGTEAFERLIGTNGYYEIVIEGDNPSQPPAAENPSQPPAAENPSQPPAAENPSQPPAAERATVRKVGQKGTPVFADTEIQTGVGTLVSAANSEWPAAQHRTLEVELSGGESAKPRRLVFDLWFLADEIHGTWAAPNPKDDARVGDTWGMVQGRRDVGDPLDVGNGANAPCMVCVRAFWNCDGLSLDEPACNSAETSWSACEARLEKARTAATDVPRGCDDYAM